MTAAVAAPSVPGMTKTTRGVLRHKRLVALAWIAVTVLAGFAAPSATNHLSHNLNTPGTKAYNANQGILQRFGIDGNEQPTLAVLTLPPGETMTTSAGQGPRLARSRLPTGRATWPSPTMRTRTTPS